MIWNTDVVSKNAMELRQQQAKDLVKLVERIYEKVPFYKKKIDEKGVKPGDIQSLDDIAKLPFTTKDELRDTYPYGLLAVDESDILEIHTSSGTTGTPVVDA